MGNQRASATIMIQKKTGYGVGIKFIHDGTFTKFI